jgi:hypothetical protein
VISNNKNGSVTSSFSNIVIDDSTLEASLQIYNGSGKICGSICFISLTSEPIHPGIDSNFKITLCIHEEGEGLINCWGFELWND